MKNLSKVFAFAIALFLADGAIAAPNAVAAVVKTVSAEIPLSAFEGIYQNKVNTFSYFKVTAVNNTLVAKQMDGDMQIVLTRKTDLEFQMKDDDGDENIPVVFSKNDAGEIAQIVIAGRDTWNRVKEYVPVKEISLTADQLKAFAGKYQSEDRSDGYIQITATATGLMLKQGWDGREIEFAAIGENDFLNKKNAFPLKFSRDGAGNVIKVLAFNRDMWDKVKE
ncbi:MAG TPA: hypothetical protein VG367_10910 [Mucilaginibacter sp.]|jgi:hypothetical protein|nr:hypothetical protein [Mucilaginibacter sp.]